MSSRRDSRYIVIGTPAAINDQPGDYKAAFKVEKWVKYPAKEQVPEKLILNGDMSLSEGWVRGMEVHERYLVFVFPPNLTGRLGSIIPISKNGDIPDRLFLDIGRPAPRTMNELVGKIEEVLSERYESRQMETALSRAVDDSERAEAIRRLGGLRSARAWSLLENRALETDYHYYSSTRAALGALYRIDPHKAAPVLLKVVGQSTDPSHVGTACHLWSRVSPDEPKALEVFVGAVKRLRNFDDAEDATSDAINAIGIIGKVTPEVEQLLLDVIKDGKGNGKDTAMTTASHFKIKRAIPLIYDVLASGESKYERGASLSIGWFAGLRWNHNPYEKPLSKDRAWEEVRRSFPQLTKEKQTAPAVACGLGWLFAIETSANKGAASKSYIFAGKYPEGTNIFPEGTSFKQKAAFLFTAESTESGR